MKFLNKVVLLAFVFMLAFSTTMSAHSGRTDSNGGHNCSKKSQEKGLCTGYHYHNSGKSSGSSNSSSSDNSKSSSSSSSSANKKSSSPQYAKSTVKYFVNNKEVKLKVSPIMKDNSNYFPIREVADSLGAVVEWNESDSTISITREKKKVVLDTKSDKLIIINNTNYAPIRLIVEGLGANITFDQDKNSINVEI